MPRSSKPTKLVGWLSKDKLKADIELRRTNQEIHDQEVSAAIETRTPPPRTPDHFWELSFPSTAECVGRGYCELPIPTSPRNRRNRYDRSPSGNRRNRYDRSPSFREAFEETRDIMTDSTRVVLSPSQPDPSTMPDNESIASTSSDAVLPDLKRPNPSLDPLEHNILFPTLDSVLHHLMLCQPRSRSLVQNTSIRTLQLQTLMRCLPWAESTLKEDVAYLSTRCVPLHPSCAERLAKCMGRREEDDTTLAQLFAPRDKLARIVGVAHKRSAHTDAVEHLLAVDGLAAVSNDVHAMPNFDVKRYADRLRFGLIDPAVFDSGEDDEAERGIQAWWSRREGDERSHVRAVRFLYQVLAHDCPTVPPSERKIAIFKALQRVYRPYSEGLRKTTEDTTSNDVEVLLTKKYLEAMGENEICLQRLANKLFSSQDNKRYRRKRKAVEESDDETDMSREEEK